MKAHDSAITSLKALTIKATQVDKGVGVREAVEGMEAGWKRSDQLSGCHRAQSPSWGGWRPAGGSAGGVSSAGGVVVFRTIIRSAAIVPVSFLGRCVTQKESRLYSSQSLPPPPPPAPGNPQSASVSRVLPVLDVFYERNHSCRAFVSDFIHLV